MYSTVTQQRVSGPELDASYWYRNLREPVQFAPVVRRLLVEGFGYFVEVSPHPVLLLALQDLLVAEHSEGAAVETLQRERGTLTQLLLAVGALHTQGAPVDLSRSVPIARRVALPTYPFQRERYWLERSSASSHSSAAVVSGYGGAASARPEHETQKPSTEAVQGAFETIIADVTGLSARDLDTGKSLLRLGIDSLMIMQIKSAVRDRFGVELPNPIFFGATTSIRSLAEHIAQIMPADSAAVEPAPDLKPSAERVPSVGAAPVGDIVRLMVDQLRALSELIQRQLETLRHLNVADVPVASPSAPASPIPTPEARPAASQPAARSPSIVAESASAASGRPTRPFVPYRPIRDRAADAPPRRPDYLEELIREFCQRTPTSKAKTQEDRFVFANNRNIAGLTPALKEMTYQIIAERSAGSRIWDLDGNEYLDFTMGFGTSLLGHGPKELSAAIQEQLGTSWALGPISNQAGEVARRVSEMTGMKRVAFFNSGSEAIMVAIRLARTVTGRSKIVVFEGAYHGMFDGILAVSRSRREPGEAVPMAPGVPESMVSDTLVLPYDDPAALEVIEARADELAAVLVEPVQSRRPELQPRAFLHQLRELTRRKAIALVFDEMITGFRTGPGGAQSWFGVEADIATYGKVVGGGMPIGIVAGSARFMDAIDGGPWSFGDDSFPQKTNTFIAGTFCSHPLSMASSLSFLKKLTDEGPALQRELNARTRSLCARLNDIFADHGLPIHVVHFASLFRFVVPPELGVFFHRLVAKGVYVWEWRNLFLSTAHSDSDIDQLVSVVRDTAGWLARDVMPTIERPPPGYGVVEIAATYPQRSMFRRCNGADRDKAYHVRTAVRVRGPLRPDRMEASITELVRRHQSLRTCFRSDGDALWQRIHPVGAFELAHEQLDEAQIPAFIERCTAPFDLAAPGLLRCAVGELGPNDWLLFLDIHHLVVDGVSMDQLVDELFALYTGGAPPEPRAQYADFAAWEQTYLGSAKMRQDGELWRSMLAPPMARLELPADYPPEERRLFEGSFVPFQLSEPRALRAFARERAVTTQMLINAVFRVFAWTISGQTDFCFGAPTAGRPEDRFHDTIGLFIGTVVYRARVTRERSFAAILDEVRTQVTEILAAQQYPFERIADLVKDPDGRPPFEIGFSYETTGGRRARQIGELTIEPYTVPPRGFTMEAVLACADDGDAFKARLAFNPRRFRRETVERWTQHYDRLARALIAAPDQPLSVVCG
jgi:glutamate-1-semialdehyde aminotransferase/acyl carrier protein